MSSNLALDSYRAIRIVMGMEAPNVALAMKRAHLDIRGLGTHLEKYVGAQYRIFNEFCAKCSTDPDQFVQEYFPGVKTGLFIEFMDGEPFARPLFYEMITYVAARALGFQKAPWHPRLDPGCLQRLSDTLQKHGPLLMYGRYNAMTRDPVIITVRQVAGKDVLYVDPTLVIPQEKRMPFDEFIEKSARFSSYSPQERDTYLFATHVLYDPKHTRLTPSLSLALKEPKKEIVFSGQTLYADHLKDRLEAAPKENPGLIRGSLCLAVYTKGSSLAERLAGLLNAVGYFAADTKRVWELLGKVKGYKMPAPLMKINRGDKPPEMAPVATLIFRHFTYDSEVPDFRTYFENLDVEQIKHDYFREGISRLLAKLSVAHADAEGIADFFTKAKHERRRNHLFSLCFAATGTENFAWRMEEPLQAMIVSAIAEALFFKASSWTPKQKASKLEEALVAAGPLLVSGPRLIVGVENDHVVLIDPKDFSKYTKVPYVDFCKLVRPLLTPALTETQYCLQIIP